MLHRTDTTSEGKPLDNDQPANLGDAHEPGDVHPDDLKFDPAEFEASANGTPPAPNPFDPARYRLSQDAAAGLGVKKTLLSIPVRKPDKSWFVRVHADPGFRLDTVMIDLKDDRESYLVDPDLWPALATEATCSPHRLLTAINRQGIVFIWPIRLPGPDGKVYEWWRTSLEVAEMAVHSWVRVVANSSLGAYQVYQATGQLPEPVWPDMPFRELLRIAFKDRVISTADHPVLRRLGGEV
jgi:hypothetical protein